MSEHKGLGVSLGDWNCVPGHPRWRFGLGVRHRDGTLEVEVFGPDDERFTLQVSGWAEAREQAVARIDERRSAVPRDEAGP